MKVIKSVVVSLLLLVPQSVAQIFEFLPERPRQQSDVFQEKMESSLSLRSFELVSSDSATTSFPITREAVAQIFEVSPEDQFSSIHKMGLQIFDETEENNMEINFLNFQPLKQNVMTLDASSHYISLEPIKIIAEDSDDSFVTLAAGKPDFTPPDGKPDDFVPPRGKPDFVPPPMVPEPASSSLLTVLALGVFALYQRYLK